MNNELKPFWAKFLDFNWKFGLGLTLIVCVPRFIMVLYANKTTDYSYIGLIMVISALAPFIFLSKEGRLAIGLTKPKNYSWLLFALALGITASILLYFLGKLAYQSTIENWYVYIGQSYNIPADIQPNDKLIMFVIMAITGMIFSPIGEELFFRGIIHSSFSKTLGDVKASVFDSAAFALTHIAHFGLIFINSQWKFLSMPTLIWVTSMFLVSILFYWCRVKAGSLIGSILCHSAFNLGMIYCIFYLLN